MSVYSQLRPSSDVGPKCTQGDLECTGLGNARRRMSMVLKISSAIRMSDLPRQAWPCVAFNRSSAAMRSWGEFGDAEPIVLHSWNRARLNAFAVRRSIVPSWPNRHTSTVASSLVMWRGSNFNAANRNAASALISTVSTGPILARRRRLARRWRSSQPIDRRVAACNGATHRYKTDNGSTNLTESVSNWNVFG